MNPRRPTLSLLALAAGLALHAQSDSQGTLGVRGASLSYSDEADRDRLTSAGLFLDLDNRESGGFRLAYSRDAVRYREGSTFDQDTLLGGFRLYAPLGAGQGKLAFQVDAFRATFQEPGTEKQAVNGVGVHVGYLSDLHPELARLWLDLGFTSSKYDGGLQVDQLTPTVGFGVNENYDWFTLSLDAITVKVSRRDQTTTSAVKASWTHYFLPGSWAKPRSLYVQGLSGERLYAADLDQAIVYTLGDTQTRRWAAGGTWGAAKGFGVSLEAGSSTFEDREVSPALTYTTPFAALSLHYTW